MLFWNIRIVALIIQVCTFFGVGFGFKMLGEIDEFHKSRKFIWYSIFCFTIMNFALFIWE